MSRIDREVYVTALLIEQAELRRRRERFTTVNRIAARTAPVPTRRSR